LHQLLALVILFALLTGCSRQEGASLIDEIKKVPKSDTLTLQTLFFTSTARKVFGVLTLPSTIPYLNAVDSAVSKLRAKNIKSQPPQVIVNELNHLVYDEWAIAFDPDQNNIQNSLPSTVYLRKRGSCLGVSFIFLTLAEKLKLPIYGVLLPGHFFVRYDDGKNRINIEPNLKGFCHPDSYYVVKYAVQGDSFYNLHDLSREHTLSAMAYALGTCALRANHLETAMDFLKSAAEVNPDYAEAFGNLGIVLDRLNMSEGAFLTLARARALRPNDKNALLNLGRMYLKMGQKDSGEALIRQANAH